MAAPYISTHVTPTTDNGLEPGLDSDQRADLDSAFTNFFSRAPEPSKEEVKEAEDAAAVAEPEDGRAEETEPLDDKAKAPPEPKVEEKKEPIKEEAAVAEPEKKAEGKVEEKKEPPKEEADPELDAFQPGPKAGQEDKAGFRGLKEKVRAYKTEAKTLKAEREALQSEVARRDRELEDARRAMQSREIPKDVQEKISQAEARAKEAEGKIKLLDLKSDRDFNAQYKDPIHKLHNELLDECVKASDNDPAIKEWAATIKAADPDLYGEQFWEQSVLAHPLWEAKKLARARVEAKVGQLTNLKNDRDQALQEFEKDPSRIDAYQKQKMEEYWGKFYLPAATDEAMKLASQLGEWASPKDLSKAKDPDQKKAFEEHNKAYQAFEDDFKANFAKINDDSENKPRLHAQVALQATKSMKLEKDLAQATAELDANRKAFESKDAEIKSRDEEIAKLRGDLDKLTAVRSAPAKATNVTAKPPAKGGDKLHQSTHDAFQEYWAEKK